ncbi:hypothetical protein [Streptomyces sp. 7N604]|uniref:hypothetical protein n=1 Tax=Streptomyces sp. 7N604 TaxID=3457415 RepID=UPI003FD13402
MTSDDDQRVVRIPSDRDHAFHHGPVEKRSTTKHIEIITFTWNEESDILHAAGTG